MNSASLLDEIDTDGKPWSPKVRSISRQTFRYGVTPEKYAELLARQHGVCKICGKPETKVQRGRVQQLSVDHDHKTHKIRGLLCGRCNAGLGFALDNPELLRRMADYLEEVR